MLPTNDPHYIRYLKEQEEQKKQNDQQQQQEQPNSINSSSSSPSEPRVPPVNNNSKNSTRFNKPSQHKASPHHSPNQHHDNEDDFSFLPKTNHRDKQQLVRSREALDGSDVVDENNNNNSNKSTTFNEQVTYPSLVETHHESSRIEAKNTQHDDAPRPSEKDQQIPSSSRRSKKRKMNDRGSSKTTSSQVASSTTSSLSTTIEENIQQEEVVIEEEGNDGTTDLSTTQMVLYFHVFIPIVYFEDDDNQTNLVPKIDIHYKSPSLSTSLFSKISKKGNMIHKFTLLRKSSFHQEIWIGSAVLPKNLSFLQFKVLISGPRGIVNSDKAVSDVTFMSNLKKPFSQIFCQFKPQHEKSVGLLKSAIQTITQSKRSVLFSFVEELFESVLSEINDIPLARKKSLSARNYNQSNDNDELIRQHIQAQQQKLVLFYQRLDGLFQSLEQILTTNGKAAFQVSERFVAKRNYFRDSTVTELKSFLLDRVETFGENTTNLECRAIMIVCIFDRIVSLTSSTDLDNFLDVVYLLRHFDVYSISTIYNHILSKLSEQSNTTPSKSMNDVSHLDNIKTSFKSGIQQLIRLFMKHPEKKNFSFWVLLSPFIHSEFGNSFHGNYNQLDTLIMYADKRRFNDEMKELFAMVEHKSSSVSQHMMHVTSSQISVIVSTLFRLASSSFDHIQVVLQFGRCLKCDNEHAISNVLLKEFTTFVKNHTEWIDDTKEKLDILKSIICSEKSFSRSFSLLEVLLSSIGNIETMDHIHAHEILDVVFIFFDDDVFVSNCEERDKEKISKLLKEVFKQIFRNKTSSTFFGRKSFKLTDILDFYVGMSSRLSKSILRPEDYQMCVLESFKGNYYFSAMTNQDLLKGFLDFEAKTSMQEVSLFFKVLEDVTFDICKKMGYSSKVLNSLLNLLEKHIDSLERAITKRHMVADTILNHITNHIYTEENMSLLLNNSELWCRCFSLCNSSFTTETVTKAAQLLDNWGNAILGHTATIDMLKELFEGNNKERFVQLALSTSKDVLSLTTLVELEEEVAQFTSLQRKTHDFCNHYCQNEHVDSSSLRDILTRLDSAIEKRVPFDAIKSLLNDQPFLKELNELQYLSKSELFLQTWNQTIDEVAQKEAQITNMNTDGSTPTVSFSVKDLKNKVFTLVTNKWIKLYNDLNSKTISFQELEHQFANFESEEDVSSEIRFLKTTCKVDDDAENNATSLKLVAETRESKEWCDYHTKIVHSFIFISRQKTYVPLVIQVLQKFGNVFRSSIVEDKYFIGLTALHYKFFVEKWENGTLFDVADIVNAAKQALKHLSRYELDLVQVLAQSDDLLEWLWQHHNTGQFNELIRVCREVTTDDAITLQSFASLISCREYLYDIVYPETKFSSCEGFLQTMKSLNYNKDSKEIERRIQDVSFIRKNLESVKQIFRDKTRSPSVNSLLKLLEIMESAAFKISTKSSILSLNAHQNEYTFEDMIIYKLPSSSKDKTFTMSDLLDIRTTVLNTSVPRELKEKHQNLDFEMNRFIELINILLSIKESVIELIKNGNILIDQYEYEFNFNQISCVDNEMGKLRNEATRLEALNASWKKDIKNIRQKYSYLNYFNMRELREILKWLECNNSANLHSMCKTIRREFTDKHLELLLSEWHNKNNFVVVDDDLSYTVLESLGNLLSALFGDTEDIILQKDRSISFSAKKDIALSLTQSNQDIENLFVISCQNEQDVESVVLSLYAVQSRLPEMYEILMCNSRTKVEDILLLFTRWSQTRSQSLTSRRIFTLANVHLLSYTTQCQVVDKLKLYLHNSDIKLAPPLVIVSGNAHQRIVNAFSNFRFDGAAITLTIEEMVEVYSQICNTYSCGTKVYTSKHSGAGKTHSIFKYACENQLELVSISLRESVDISSLISQLNEKTNRTHPVALYFNISSHVDSIVNAILFQLIVVGSISDYNGQVYHRREVDSILIEIPNAPQNITLEKFVPLCNFLPKQVCEVTAETLLIEKRFEMDDFGRVTSAINSKLLFVCAILKAFEKGTFSNPELFAQFVPDDYLEPQECFDILMRYCNTTGQTSFSLISNFVDFTYEFFQSIMKYELLRVLPSLEPLTARIPHSLIALALEMTKDFAMRQLVLNFNTANPSLEEYAKRFSSIRKWEQSTHPVLIFTQDDFTVAGFNVIALKQESVKKFFSDQEIHILHEQKLDINFDFNTSLTQKGQIDTEIEGLKFLTMVNGSYQYEMADYYDYSLREKISNSDYVLTQDNLMKMFAIILRFKCNLPVIILGETGCGKSFLMAYLSKILEMDLRRITLHGGHSEKDIIDFIYPIIEEANSHAMANYIVFFDESNTCAHTGILKEIVCDRVLNGLPIPKNIKIVCALNPYRLKNENTKKIEAVIQSQSGILYKHPSFKNIPDPLENLVYRVHPLPDSFIDHVYDFGSLSIETERIYIRSMLQKGLRAYVIHTQHNPTLEIFVDLICTSQQFVREAMHEVSVVSLRDVKRSVQVFSWLFEEHKKASDSVFWDILKLETQLVEFSIHNINFLKCLVLSLAFTFYSRLNRDQRQSYLRKICEVGRIVISSFTSQFFVETVTKYQNELTTQLNPGEGISLNEALTENCFMLFLALLNHIPIILVGFAGSSKSLAVDLISKAMRGKASTNKRLHHLPDINIFAYQCSPLSTARGIAQTFRSARRYAEESSGSSSLSVVLLDEISLADSPNLPLKILHHELENLEKISFIAISNYSLDSSKMNRMSILYRSIPTSKDLKNTAKGIIGVKKLQLNNYLEAIAQSYLELFNTQKIKLFFGLRDFYQCIKFLNRVVNDKMVYDGKEVSFDQALLLAILRNFGGVPKDQVHAILKIFETKTGSSLTSSQMPRPTNKELIQMNLKDSTMARHLMLLTHNNAALNLLFDYNILSLSETLVLFGSDFPLENNDNFALSLQLQKIKLAMSDGRTVVLVHLVEQKKFARLAFGNESVTCAVHDNFRIVVIAEASDAYSKLAAPFLNRLEKHSFNRIDFMTEENSISLSMLETFVSNLVDDGLQNLPKIFVGCHDESLKSLVQALYSTEIDNMVDEGTSYVYTNAIEKLLWVASPEHIVKSGNREIIETYFMKQDHSSFPSLLNKVFAHPEEWSYTTSNGIQAVVMTYSPLDINIETTVKSDVTVVKNEEMKVQFIQLHELKTSADLNSELDHFFNSDHDQSLLIILADPNASSVRRIRYAQYTCENKRELFIKNNPSKIRNVVIVVNLIRGLSFQESRFTFDFDKRWNYIFIDDISSNTKAAFPDMFTLVSKPLSKILSELPIMDLTLANLHNSLSRIVYPYPRTPDSIQKQIITIRNLLSSSQHRFYQAVQEKMLDVLKITTKNDDKWYLEVMEDEKLLQICGTLNSALQYFISKKLFITFAAVLSVTDRFNNFSLLNDNDVRDFWLEMFQQNVQPKMIQDLLISEQLHGHINVHYGTQLPHFNAQFPFSYLISIVSEGVKKNMMENNTDKDNMLEKLEKHFECTYPNLLEYTFINNDSSNVMIDENKQYLHFSIAERFIHDYFTMYGFKYSTLSLDKCKQLIMEIVNKDLGNKSEFTITDLQVIYWSNEPRFKTYFHVLDLIRDASIFENLFYNIPTFESIVDCDIFLYQLVIDAINPTNAINWKSLTDIEESRSWVNNVHIISECCRLLRQLIDSTLLSENVSDSTRWNFGKQNHIWKCISFFSKFLQDLAFKRGIDEDSFDVSICENYWKKLSSSETTHFEQPNMFIDFLQTLTDINKKYSRSESAEDFECFICYTIPDPTELRKTKCCSRYVCIECANNYCSSKTKNGIQNQSCGWCQRGVNLSSVETYTELCDQHLDQVQEMSSKENIFIERASKLTEIFIIHYCLQSENMDQLSAALISTIIQYLSENKKILSDNKLLKFIVNDSMRSSVIRSLVALKKQNTEIGAVIEHELEDQLSTLYSDFKHADFPLAVAISQILEDEIESSVTDEINNEHLLHEKLEKKLSMEPLPGGILKFLQSICSCKVAVRWFAQCISSKKEPSLEFIETIDHLFQNNYSLLVFFFRELAKSNGLSATRSMINYNPMLKQMAFIETWKQKEEAIIFISDNGALSDSNPFATLYDQLPNEGLNYNTMRDAVEQLRLSDAKTDTLLNTLYERSRNSRNCFCALLLMVLLEHVTLRRKISQQNNYNHLLVWMRNNKAKLVVFENISIVNIVERLIENNIRNFEITPETSMSKIHLLRCLIHQIVMVIWNLNTPSMGFFWNCLTNITQLHNTLFPTMNDDITSTLTQITGGKTYTCPNGHAYIITECGRAMVTDICRECGQPIGGSSHTLLSTNREYQNVDNTPLNFCARSAIEETSPADVHSTNRDLSSTEFRLIRLLMSGLLYASGIFFNNNTRVLINTQYCNPADANQYFMEHFTNDWHILSQLTGRNEEDLCITLHHTFAQISYRAATQSTTLWFHALTHKDQRRPFENNFCTQLLEGKFKPDRILTFIQETLQRHNEARRDRKTTLANSKLMKHIYPDQEVLSLQERTLLLPSIFMPVESITLEHFMNSLKQTATMDKLQALAAIVDNIVPLQAMHHLPNIFDLYRLVCKRFDKRIRRENALNSTVREIILEMEDESERTLFEACFESFAQAWNSVFKLVERYECLEIPHHMKEIKMSKDQPLIYIVPSEKDEPIFGLAMVHYLVGIQNKLTELISKEYFSMESKDLRVVTSRELTPTHVVNISLQRHLLPFIKDHCNRSLSFEKPQQIIYDFEFIQQYLIDNFFLRKSLIEIQIKMLDFTGEIRVTGAKEKFSALKKRNTKISNDKLTQDDQEMIINELGGPGGRSERCVSCFRYVEMAIHFIQSSLSVESGVSVQFLDKYLVDYLEKDLMIQDARKLFGSLSQTLQIKHLDHLFEILEQHLTLDIFAGIHDIYKEPLSPELKHKLTTTVMPYIDCQVLMSSMRDAMVKYLSETFTQKESDLCDWLQDLPLPEYFQTGQGEHALDVSTIGELDWFKEIPMGKFKVANALDFYKTLEDILEKSKQ
ncbi:hypothetical protein C9374_010994 [Naegleria lovaniensis]|uniref:RZ-type domain-containing protein n=1 Tax=Naegleria lovaniensis TaxID=51637 RepID=A0AA88GEJ3_NAELO|nr:uncharacterized protein C9374_010994 [Naegleria lovaniensis]KAG2374157.1 hypothetical protein C9374_010994 [Naegleria lovaniensis]